MDVGGVVWLLVDLRVEVRLEEELEQMLETLSSQQKQKHVLFINLKVNTHLSSNPSL